MHVYVARGAATGPTATASYDAALADANLHNYNLVPVSSVLPAGATVDPVEAAPDLGPAGERLTVVEARATTDGSGPVCAGIGWAVGSGPGLLYEAADAGAGADADAVAAEISDGLAAGRALRDWCFDEQALRVESAEADADADGHTTAVVVATLGTSDPI